MKLIEEILSENNLMEAIKRVKANKGVAGVDRPNRDCHLAIDKVLTHLNNGHEWIIDLDIEKYFDTVNHDKLISILRENVNDSHTLHLIR